MLVLTSCHTHTLLPPSLPSPPSFLSSLFPRAADPRFSEEQVEQMYKKGESIRAEFAELFTGI